MSLAYETKGHRASQPGLRGHSVGQLFPFTVIARGHGDVLLWHAMDMRTGNEGRPCRTYNEAVIDIASIKLRNLMHS